MDSLRETRRVAILAYPDVSSLDVAGPGEAFAALTFWFQMNEPGEAPPYETIVVAPEAGPVTTCQGVTLYAAVACRDLEGPVDTLIVAGGIGFARAAKDPEIQAFLAQWAPRVRRLASGCSGSLILAEAGLLAGRRATTHWDAMDLLAQYEDVEPDRIFVRDGNVYTSAGVTASIDLALAFIEEDIGPNTAYEVAKHFILYLKRPSRQPQLSAPLASQAPRHLSVRTLQLYIASNVGDDLSIPALAERMSMSIRNFTRVFTREAGVSPGKFVRQVRVESTRRRLEQTAEGVDQIAWECGFGNAENMRRVFQAELSLAPVQYRQAS